MRRAIQAEWAKATSDPGTAWLLAGLAVLTVTVSLITIGATKCPAGALACGGQDPAGVSLTGVYAGQAVAALAGVLAVGGEYGTGMIKVTLSAMPRRGRVLAAKAVVLAGPMLAVAALTVVISMLAGALMHPGTGFGLATGAMWRACLCAALYLVLIALVGLGVATAVRDSAAATGVALGLVYLFPVAAGLVSSPSIRRLLLQIGPMSAGLDSQATAGLSAQPLTWWQGIGVVSLWAAGALLAGGAVLRWRDAE